VTCSFCGAKGVKLDAINYGGKLAMRCITCKVLDGVQADSTETICGDCLIPLSTCQHAKEYRK
jgi:hypothetical protein